MLRVQYGDCAMWHNWLTIIGWEIGVLCLFGTPPACIAALTSYALLEYSMRQVGC